MYRIAGQLGTNENGDKQQIIQDTKVEITWNIPDEDKEIKVVNKGERGVTVDGIYAYEQPKKHLGSFSGDYSNLTLPSRHRE